mgnify:FL=1
MTKSKSNGTNSINYYKSVFSYDLFKKEQNNLSLAIYSGILILIISILNLLKGSLEFNNLGGIQSFFYSIIGIVLLSLLSYGLIFIFLCAFEKKNRTFLNSYLTFLSLSLPFLLIGHILNWIRSVMVIDVINFLFGILIVILVIYYVFNLVKHFKIYFNTTGFKLIASFILADIIVLTLAMLQYLSYLLLSIQ